MRRMILSVFGGLLAAALLISPAHAVKPVIVEEETIRFDGTPILDPDLSEACGFPGTVSTTGHIRDTEFRDKAGNTRLVTSHPSLSETLTSQDATIQTSDRGLDEFTETPRWNTSNLRHWHPPPRQGPGIRDWVVAADRRPPDRRVDRPGIPRQVRCASARDPRNDLLPSRTPVSVDKILDRGKP